jgi:hypothetical protein
MQDKTSVASKRSSKPEELNFFGGIKMKLLVAIVFWTVVEGMDA